MQLGPYIYCSLFPCLPLQASLSLCWKTFVFGLHNRQAYKCRALALRTTNVRWKAVDINTSGGTTMRNALQRGPRWTEPQLATVVTCSLTHLVLAPPTSLSRSPMLLSEAPWNHLPNKLFVLKSLSSPLLGKPNLKQQKKLSERLADENEDSNRSP